MNHTAIVKGLRPFKQQVQFLAQNSSGKVPLVLSEVGNTLLASPTEPDPGYVARNNLGSALWAVDFQLYAMSIGIGRVHMQQILSAGYSLWSPVDAEGYEAQVRPNFYSQPFIADFIGTSSETKVVNLHVTGGVGHSGLCGYAAYDAGKPARIALSMTSQSLGMNGKLTRLVNFNFWSEYASTTESLPSPTNRPVHTVNIRLPSEIRSAAMQTLNSPEGAYGNSSLTWRGLE